LNPEERLAPIVEMTEITEAVREAIAFCQTDPPEIKEDFEREERET
jgi:hypothetical protein